MRRRLALAALLTTVLALNAPAASALDDNDADGIPDAVESILCGREVARALINTSVPQVGRCVTSADFVPGYQPTIDDVDGDHVPDYLEPTICAVEDQNEAYDGSCAIRSDGTPDYLPGSVPPATLPGDRVESSGIGSVDVTAPDGQVFHSVMVPVNPSLCVGCAKVVIPPGIDPHGHWRVHAYDNICCGGTLRFSWTIAGWIGDSGLVCGGNDTPTIDLDYDTRTVSVVSCS